VRFLIGKLSVASFGASRCRHSHPGGSGIEGPRTVLKSEQIQEHFVAAVYAILAVVVVFAILNLLEYRRLD